MRILRRPLLAVFTCLFTLGMASSCVPSATWPKLIGYGTADTSVISASRCSTTGQLVLALQTTEDEFVKNVPSS